MVGDPALEQLPVMSERLGAVVPGERFAGRESIALAELTELAYAGSPSAVTNAYFRGLDRQLHELGIRKRVELGSATFEGVAEIVAGGLAFAISMLDARSPMRNYLVGEVAVLPFTDFHPRLETGLLWRKDRAQSGDLGEVIDLARELFTEPLFA